MPSERPKVETVGFGFEPAGGAYHFVVTIPRGEEGNVRVAEHFVYGEEVEEAAQRARMSDDSPGRDIRHSNPKVFISVGKWNIVAKDVQDDFNRRLRNIGQKPHKWKVGDNLLAPHLGKELVLLLWSIEDADPGYILNALYNWQGLVPEERWWLYTTINAATGNASEGRGRGWRKAIQIAFTENPVEQTRPQRGSDSNAFGDRQSSNGNGANGASPRSAKRTKAQQRAEENAQPALLALDELPIG